MVDVLIDDTDTGDEDLPEPTDPPMDAEWMQGQWILQGQWIFNEDEGQWIFHEEWLFVDQKFFITFRHHCKVSDTKTNEQYH